MKTNITKSAILKLEALATFFDVETDEVLEDLLNERYSRIIEAIAPDYLSSEESEKFFQYVLDVVSGNLDVGCDHATRVQKSKELFTVLRESFVQQAENKEQEDSQTNKDYTVN